MPHVPFSLRRCALPLAALLLAACSTPAPVATAPKSPALSPANMVAAIRAAGEREQSVIAVHPLADPGITAWQQSAQADEQAGHYDAAAAKLEQALQRSPDAPELLQDRAELAVFQHDYALAQKLALQSWTLGPKSGPLCARNQETLVQLRQQAGDAAGAASAQQSLAQCHVQGIKRY